MGLVRQSILGLLVLIVFASEVAASAPSVAQQRCLRELEAAGAAVAEAAMTKNQLCIRKFSNGTLDPSLLRSCLDTPSARQVRAMARTRAIFSTRCSQLPDFGANDADRINTAFSSLADLSGLLGSDIGSALTTRAENPRLARCQMTLAQERTKLAVVELTEFRRCVAGKSRRGELASAADLHACMNLDAVGVRRAKRTVERRIAAQCDLSPIADAAPGRCATASGAAELGQCLAAETHCNCCTAINQANDAAAACHTFSNGAATYYCGTRPTDNQSVARQWDEQILNAIRRDTPRPPVHARNLYHLSAAMYDAWATYDPVALPVFAEESKVANNPNATDERRTAISFAAYRILSERYSKNLALGSVTSQASFDALMNRLGLDIRFTDTVGDSAAALGNRIAATVIERGLADGSNESANFRDATYQPVNKPLIVKEPDIALTDPDDPNYQIDPNRWQPLALDKTVTQNGIPLPDKIQTFIGSQWGDVVPFAIAKGAPADLYLDPGPPPKLNGIGDSEYRQQAVRVIELAAQLTPDDPATLDTSPGRLGNNSLGWNDGIGYSVNPITGQPYAPRIALRGDFGRVLAEYWADGPHSETPPGHWNLLANSVADTEGFARRLGGSGPSLDALEWDVKTYLTLNGALHDAAIACWGGKRKYDSARPITMIRYMAKHGQSSNPTLPSYHPNGLPLIDGLIELITPESAAPGGRHAHLVAANASGQIGDIAVLAWPGSPENTSTQYAGVRWVLGKAWVPYQRNTFVTPAFAGYFSGHSTFSRSAAEVLAALTGSPYFPGGLHEFVARKNAYLIHELGPSEDVHLQWASYFDAADQAGQSRLWGGIHPEADDFTGRRVGHEVGLAAVQKAFDLFGGIDAP